MQQKTLSKLRVAVSQQMAPRPSPKIYLPDRFKQATTELEDGTVVAVDDDSDNDRDDIASRINDLLREERGMEGSADGVHVRPTTEEDASGPNVDSGAQKPLLAGDNGDERVPRDDELNMAAVVAEGGPDSEEKPISRAERRRRIKAEIQRLSQGDEPVYYQRRLW